MVRWVHERLVGCRALEPLCVPRTLSLPLTSTFAGSRRRDEWPQSCQHDRALWPADSRT